MRLDKLLSHLGYGSRKEVKAYIREGYILVDGVVITDDDYKVDEGKAEILFLNEEIHYEEKVYLILNKPEGYISATEGNEPTVINLVKEYKKMGVFPVGRLDKDTTGLLLITNDGKLAHRMLSPKKHINKVYEMTFEGTFREEYYKCFQEGIVLDDGYKCLSASFELLEPSKGRITISEGKYHQVKRMMKALNMEVTALKRIKFGPLELDENLKEGKFRFLTEEERRELNL